MKLASMKLDPAELKKKTEPAETLVSDRPIYPWGLQVRLDEDALAKLGITTLPKVDGEMMLLAKVKVVSVSSNEHSSDGAKGKHKHRSVELQICEMGLGDVPADKKDTAAELYGEG